MNKVIIGFALLTLLGCKEITLSVKDVKNPGTTEKTISLEFDFYEPGLFSCKETSEALESCGSADYDYTPIYCILSCSKDSPLRYEVQASSIKYKIEISDGTQTRYVYLLYNIYTNDLIEVANEHYEDNNYEFPEYTYNDIIPGNIIHFEDYIRDLQPLEKIISLQVDGVPM